MDAKTITEAREHFAELRRTLASLDRRPAVLLVEDNRDDVDLVKKKLHRFHVSLETAVTSLEAIEQFKARAFDVTFLDLKLDVGSGLDVLRYARNESIKTLFIVLTGVNDANPIIKEALSEGANFVIQKPISDDHLQAILGTLK